MFSPLIAHLMTTFRTLPGIGPKSAARMAFHILERDREGGRRLATALLEAVTKIENCEQCRTLCETSLCQFCSNPARDRSMLCVVETPGDIMVIEQTGSYRGQYFVLMGHLSPLDGIGPEEIGIDLFRARLAAGEIKEVILATNPTVEGEATAHYLAELVKAKKIQATRIAYGVPVGGELEYIDVGTMARALASRSNL